MTGFGAYSTQNGPWWLLALLFVCGFVLAVRALAATGSQPSMFPLIPGAIFYTILLAAAVFFNTNGLPGLPVQAISWLTVFLLVGVAMSAHALGGAFAWAAAASVVLCTAINSLEFLFLPNQWSTAPGRSAGFHENPNISALALVGSWVVLYALRAHVYSKVVWFAAILAAAGLVLTFSRGGMLVATVIALFIMYKYWRGGGVRTARLVILLVSAMGLIYLLLQNFSASSEISDDAWLRVNSMLTMDFSDDSSQHRSYLIGDYWSLLADNPLSGYSPFFSISSIDGLGPHNNFLGLGVDFGIFVMLIFIAAALPGFRFREARSRDPSSSGQSLLLSILVLLACVFSHNIAYSAIGAALLGAIAGLTAQCDQSLLCVERQTAATTTSTLD